MGCDYTACTPKQLGAEHPAEETTHTQTQTVPCFFNYAYLLVEINELNQLFLKYFLSADYLFDEHMLEQVQHIWSELKVLNQTSVERKGKGRGGRGQCLGFILFKLHPVMHPQSKYLFITEARQTGERPHSLADEVIKVVRPELWLVEGRRRVPAQEGNGKDKWKDKMRFHLHRQAREQRRQRRREE